MIIEFNLIQNFVLAAIAVGFVVAVGAIIKNIFSKKRTAVSNEANKSTSELAKNPEIKKSREFTDYNKIIKHAQKHAHSILRAATIEASNILTGTRKTNEHVEEKLDKVFQDIAAADIHSMKSTTGQFDKEYKEALGNFHLQMQQSTTEALQNTQNRYNEKIEEFTQDLLKKGLSTQEIIDKKTAELLSIAESEITEYKKNKIATIDEQVNNLLQKVYRDVLRISMPENVHQELIIKSLEEAKKDELFKL